MDIAVNLAAVVDAANSTQLDASHATFSLHPPVEGEILLRSARHGLWLPFSTVAADAWLGVAPRRRVRVRAGSLWYAEPDAELRVQSSEPLEALWVAVDGRHFDDLAARLTGERTLHTHNVVDLVDAGIEALSREMRRTLLADPLPNANYLQLLADAVTTRLLCHFLDQLEQPLGTESIAPFQLAQLVKYVDEHIGEALRVEELARRAGLSRSHFSRAFQRATGDAPQRFILKRRLCHARQLLSTGTTSLAQVAVRTGFASQAHMTSAFKKELGVTPSRYRQAFTPGVYASVHTGGSEPAAG